MRVASAVCIGLAAMLSAPAFAQEGAQAAAYAVSPWRIIASLLLCVALGAVAILALRQRYGLGRLPLRMDAASRRIKIVEHQSLAPQRSIYLVEIDGADYAVVVAPQSTAITVLPSPAINLEASPK